MSRIHSACCCRGFTPMRRFNWSIKQDALAVPLQAVDHTANGTTVDVVDASNKIEIRSVVLGIQTATDAEVLSGLKEGDMVVVSDRSSLKAGQVVQPKSLDLMQYRQPRRAALARNRPCQVFQSAIPISLS